MKDVYIKEIYSIDVMKNISAALIPSIYTETELARKKEFYINIDFFLSGFAAFNTQYQPLAHVVLYNNPGINYLNHNVLLLGNFECVESKEVALKLFQAAEKFAKEQHKNFLIGPMNGSTWEEYRFITEGDENIFFTEPVHKKYYSRQFLQTGFSTIACYNSARDTELKFDAASIEHRKQKFGKEGMQFRNINLQNFENDLQKLYRLSAQAFRKNFLYSPIAEHAFYDKYLKLKKFINPRHVLLSEQGEEIAGFIFCLEDIYDANYKSLIVKTFARADEKEFAGLGTLLGEMIIQIASEDGYASLIHAFMHRENVSAKISAQQSGKVFRKYELYGKSIL